MVIKRDYYLEQINIRENNGLVKVITGVRRCGKSYLLFKLFLNNLLERGISRDHITIGIRQFLKESNSLDI